MTWPDIEAVTGALCAGAPLPDAVFDRLLPEELRRLSSHHWTPVDVARRAASWLTEHANGHPLRVLDIGAGVGKLCIIGALTTRARFEGIEHRPQLARIAADLARATGARDALVTPGTLAQIQWEHFDGFYLFNPFEENVRGPSDHLDGTVELSPQRYQDDVAQVERGLLRARIGARVVTYNGFGGLFPSSYHLARSEPAGDAVLRLWIKVDARNDPRVRHAEIGDETHTFVLPPSDGWPT